MARRNSAARRKSDPAVDEGAAARDDSGNEAEKFEYELLEAGSIIDGKQYPDAEAEEGRQMIVELTEEDAKKHQAAGVPLRRHEE